MPKIGPAVRYPIDTSSRAIERLVPILEWRRGHDVVLLAPPVVSNETWQAIIAEEEFERRAHEHNEYTSATTDSWPHPTSLLPNSHDSAFEDFIKVYALHPYLMDQFQLLLQHTDELLEAKTKVQSGEAKLEDYFANPEITATLLVESFLSRCSQAMSILGEAYSHRLTPEERTMLLSTTPVILLNLFMIDKWTYEEGEPTTWLAAFSQTFEQEWKLPFLGFYNPAEPRPEPEEAPIDRSREIEVDISASAQWLLHKYEGICEAKGATGQASTTLLPTRGKKRGRGDGSDEDTAGSWQYKRQRPF